MNIKVLSNNIETLNENVIVMLFKGETLNLKFEEINKIAQGFDGIYGSIDLVKLYKDDKIINIFLVGLGEEAKVNSEKIRCIGGNIAHKVKNTFKENKVKNIKLDILNKNLKKAEIGGLVEGMLLGSYEFNKYRSNKKDIKINDVNIFTYYEVNEEIEKAKTLAMSTIIGRDLVNEPSNIIYPESLANEVLNLGKEYGFEVEVYEEDKIKELEMDAFLAVSKGSSNKPRFIIMRYFGNKESKDVLGLVGKGLTYDTGGYSIKTNGGMLDMKTDMAGAASVIGAMCAITKDKLKTNVVGVIAACENSISGNAYKPGDIINSMGKRTIEITNTDAEGRLTLADAVYYIVNEEKVTKVIDVATLTGAAVVALGSIASPIITNNDDFYGELEKAASLSGEKIWRMPNFDEYKKMLIGNEADLKNSPGREGGCITAGLFIGEFVGNTPWIHMDIAGTSSTQKTQGYKVKGGTGEAIRTLYYLAK